MNRVIIKVGIREESESSRPGVIQETITEITRPAQILDMQYKTNDSKKDYNESYPLYNTKISIIENDILKKSLPNIVYITVNEIKFSVENIRDKSPRIEIEIGGFYNG